MSSDEDDEFFDAPNAFVSSSLSKWSDSNEDLSLTALEIVSKNAERRNRVESLRRNGNTQSSLQYQDTLKDVSTYKEDSYQQSVALSPNLNSQIDSFQNQPPIVQAVLYQQQLINQLQGDPNICNCMKNLINTISNQVITDKTIQMQQIQQLQHHPLNNLPPVGHPTLLTESSNTQSCPECYKPIHSLNTTLDINVLNNIKSWSLDTARISGSEGDRQKLIYNGSGKEQSRTLPSDMMSQNTPALEARQKMNFGDLFQSQCPNCQKCNEYSTKAAINSNQYLIPPDQSFTLPLDESKVNNSSLNTTHTCPCPNKPKISTLDHFSRHDSMKNYGKSSKESTLFSSISNEPKISVNNKTLINDIPPEMNPIEIQFRERTKSMEKMLKETRNTSLQKSEDSERLRDNNDFSQRAFQSLGGTVKRLQKNVKSAWTVVSKAKIFNQDEEASSEDEEFVGNRGIRLRSSRRMKGQRDFLQIKLVQEMKDEHTGAIWAMRFSPCGRLLATAGYDRAIRVWVLRQYYWYFKQYQKNAGVSSTSNSNSDKVNCEFGMSKQQQQIITEEEICGIDSVSLASTSISTGKTDGCGSTCSSGDDDIEQGRRTPFRSRPLVIYRGHEGVVTDLVWSKNLFLLATSMDRQVRLWHISRRECLCVFNHNDTVPTVVFHPKDDRYFLSGSLDGKLRLWNIPDKKIRYWVEALLPNSLPSNSVFFQGRLSSNNLTMPPKTVITCAAFVCEATKIAVGTYDGRVLFYTSELEYITSMAIKSSHGKNRHCRVTAIEVDPTDSCKILVTSNDSRVRLIDARDYHITCKYRGFSNCSSQIRASFSPTGKYVISGSENNFFYIWKKDVEINRMTRFSTTRKDRNNYWEAIKAHETVVSVSAFSPAPHLVLDKRYRRRHSVNVHKPSSSLMMMPTSESEYVMQQPQFPFIPSQQQQSSQLPSYSTAGIASNYYLGEVIVSADINGLIRVFKNRIHSHPVSVNK